MSTKQVKDKLSSIVDDCTGIRVYFVDRTNKIWNSDIENNVLEEFRDKFCDSLKTKYTEHENFTCPLLSNYDERKNALFEFDFDEEPFEFSILSQALERKADQPFPDYEVKNAKLENIDAVIVILKNSNGQSVAFYQHVYPVSLLGPDKGVLNLTTHATRVVKLENDVLKISTKFVVMLLDGKYYIENVSALETQLKFKDVIHERARTSLEVLKGKGLIEDITKFSCQINDQTAFARKFVKAFKNSPVITQDIPNEDIVKFAMERDYLSQSLKSNDENTQFKLDSINRCRKFLDLLDDDFLKSELTNNNYKARVKDQL